MVLPFFTLACGAVPGRANMLYVSKSPVLSKLLTLPEDCSYWNAMNSHCNFLWSGVRCLQPCGGHCLVVTSPGKVTVASPVQSHCAGGKSGIHPNIKSSLALEEAVLLFWGLEVWEAGFNVFNKDNGVGTYMGLSPRGFFGGGSVISPSRELRSDIGERLEAV